MEQKHIRVVRGSFIGVIIFVVSIIMARQLDTAAPAAMGLALFAIYLAAEWVTANSGKSGQSPIRESKSAVSALSSKSGGAIAGLAFVIGLVVILVAFFGLKTPS